jgi:hypothetical protein
MSTSADGTGPTWPAPIDPAWRTWGPYLSDRQWGTVREDYSEYGTAWDSFPHDHARSRAYRWGEDGLLGLSDDQGRLCFALALWNGADPILKERLFGLTGSEGNHGEDVKEYYYYLDATPDHAYLKGLYKYPQRAFPYDDLVAENRRRGRDAPEYELLDTGVFAGDRYFDVEVEYAKVSHDDIMIKISVTNRGPQTATLHLLPTLWFRNTWAWGRDERRPRLRDEEATGGERARVRWVRATHPDLGEYWLACQGSAELLFTENETNAARLWGGGNRTRYVKDGINDFVVNGDGDAVNPERLGTKVAARYRMEIGTGATETVLLRLSAERHGHPFAEAAAIFAARQAEADRLYAGLAGGRLSDDEARVQRQALAGLIWSKQFYGFDVDHWLEGDPIHPPPHTRRRGRNSQWRHHSSSDVISMPDKWEYPWYAAWDLAFHCVAFGLIDPAFAKEQLLLMLREWYMHPNGQIPAYEWAFGDVNPPVQVLAARLLAQREQRLTGSIDYSFLARVFHKLLLNFNWWVNRKDADGSHIFEGGFLGLDNIGVIDRSSALPAGVRLEQSDGTAWMAIYCLGMNWMALELTHEDPDFEDMLLKFFEHFMDIGGAINGFEAGGAHTLWDEEDGFYYDTLRLPDGGTEPMKVRSLVGLLPIVPAFPYRHDLLVESAPNAVRHAQAFLDRHPELASLAVRAGTSQYGQMGLLTLVPEDRLRRVLARMFDPNEFLSDYGIRSISRYHLDHHYELRIQDHVLAVRYEPAESSTGMFGGNSNWRGPIWFPMNYLLVMGLRRLYRFFGDVFLVEYPTGSGQQLTLDQIADDLSRRLISVFLRDESGRRPVFGGTEVMQTDPHWRDHLLFYEYFHGDNGAGIGASHQTGWTALVASLLDDVAVPVADRRAWESRHI